MSKVFCLVPNAWSNRELIKKFGNDTAYHVVHLNKGHDLTKAPNGKGSLLYDNLGEMFGYEKAITNKAYFYTTDFRKKFGDWLNNGIAEFSGPVKPGVEELFDSNPELANSVYQSLGFENLTKDQLNNITNMNSDINNGWKLHLSIKGVEEFESTEDSTPSNEIEKRATKTISILNALISRNLIQNYKIGNDGGQPGKNITAYIGNSKTIDEVVKLLSTDELRESNVEGNLSLVKGISARFDSHRNDLELDSQKYKLFRYGVNGIPNIKYGSSGFNQYSNEEIPYSLELLQASLGNYFNSSSIINNKLNKLYPNATQVRSQITPEQKQQALQVYSQYLDTIFPNSKVKDIVYHGTQELESVKNNGFDKSKIGSGESTSLQGKGFYFAKHPQILKSYAKGERGGIIHALINVNNPLQERIFPKFLKNVLNISNVDASNIYEVGDKVTKWLKDNNKDSVLWEQGQTIKKGTEQQEENIKKILGNYFDFSTRLLNSPHYSVFEPEQIHILGSKEDIEGFEKFVQRPEIKIKLDKNGEPILTDFLQLMGKVEAQNPAPWGYRIGEQQSNSATLNYESSKKAYSPILNTLSEQLNVPWEEAELNGEPAAYQDGKVLVDFNNITADAPFHEFMHPIILLMEINNPKSLDRLVREALGDKDIVSKVDQRNPNLEKGGREYRMELVATAVGEYAVQAVNAVESKGLFAAIKEFFQDFFDMIRSLTISDYKISIDRLSDMNLKEIGFMMGVRMPKLSPTDAQTFYKDVYKSASVKKKDYGILNNLTRLDVDYLQDRLGYYAVEVLTYPNVNSGATTYTVRVSDPLSTQGKRLYRKKEQEPIAKTDDAFFNRLIAAVNEKANSKENELKSALSAQERHKTRIEARYFRTLVGDIAKFRTLDQALEVMRKEISKMNIRLNRPQQLDDISSSLKLLNSFKEITKSYGKDNTDSSVYEGIKEISTVSDRLYHRYAEKFTDQFKQEYLDKGGYQNVADGLTESIRDINALSLQTIGSSFGQNAIEQAVDHIIRLDAHEQNQKRREFVNELYKKLDNVGGSSDLSWMVEGNGIMLKTNPEFFKKQEEIRKLIIETSKSTYEFSKEIKKLETEAINLQASGKFRDAVMIEGKIKELKDKIAEIRRQGYTWDGYHKFMMQYFTYEMDESKAAHFEEDMDVMKEMYYYENADGKLVLDKEAFQKAVESYNPLMFQDYLNGDLKYPNQGWKYFKLIPKAGTESKLTNPKYFSLTPAQKEFYDFFVEKFAEASNNIYDQYIDDDMSHDALVRNFMSGSDEVNQRLGMLDSAKKWLNDLIPEREGAEELDIHGVYTGMNRKSIKFTPISAFLKPGVQMQNQNIISAFEKFYDAGIASKYKSRVASLLESGKELAASMKRLDFDSDGNLKKDVFGDPATVTGRTKVSQRLEHIIENYLTKDVYEDMFGHIKIAGKKLTGERIIDMINDFTRFRQLGLNPFSGISNMMMGAANNWTYSKRGEFFTADELRSAYFKLKNNTLRYVTYNKVGTTDESLKIKLLAEQMGVTRQLLEKKYGNILDKAFTFQESGEFINQMASALAVMSNKRTVEALVGKDKKLVDRSGREREILDIFKVDGQMLVLDDANFDFDALGIDQSKILAMSDAISKINKEVHGDYDQLNTMFLKRNALGRAAATFRTWLPQAIMQRFGKERSDYQLTAFYGEDIKRKGRYVSLVDVIKDKGVGGSFTMLGNFVTGFIPFVDGSVSDELGLGKLDAANINQTLSELRLFTTIFAATVVMGKVSDDDEELEDNSAFNFLYNMTARYENELSTFYYPTASYKLFKDAIPAFDTLEQLGDVLTAAQRKITDPEKDIYQKGFRKGTSKLSKELQLLLPVSKQIQNIWSTLNIQYEKTAYNNK